jgi:hypothetical protein
VVVNGYKPEMREVVILNMNEPHRFIAASSD